MKRFSIYLIVTVFTFLVGVASFTIYQQYKAAIQNNLKASLQDDASVQPPQANSSNELEIEINGWKIPDLTKCKINKRFSRFLPQNQTQNRIFQTHYLPRAVKASVYGRKPARRARAHHEHPP